MSNAKSGKPSPGKAPSLPVYEHPPQVTPVPVATNPLSLPFPEWSDQDINAEKWDAPKPKEKPKPNSPPEQVPQYVDPHFIHMPKSLPVAHWKRPNECFINVPLVMYIEAGFPDMISENRHLLHSEFVREFIAAVGVLNYLGIHRPFAIEFTTPTYLPTTDGIPWKPWHHIYSMCKGGKGQKHNPQVNQLGKYVVRLYWMGCWRKITVDDQLPINDLKEVILPILHNAETGEIQIWPFILCKALLKLANLSQTEDDELLDFDIIHCLTGWFPYKLNLMGMKINDVWDMCTGYTDHFSWPNPSNKSDTKSLPTEQSFINNDNKKAPCHVLAVCSDMRFIKGDTVPDLSPCWSHHLLIDQTRDIPLIQPDPLPDLERWKRFRWLAWATNNGLWPKPQLEPIKCVKIISNFKKCSDDGLLKTPSKRSLDIKRSVAVVEDLAKTGEHKDCSYTLPSRETDGCIWLDFNKLAPHLSYLSIYFKVSGFKDITKISDFLSKDVDKGKADKGKKGKEAEGNSVKIVPWQFTPAMSRNHPLYIFCDSLDPKLVIINIAQIGNVHVLSRSTAMFDKLEDESQNEDVHELALTPFAYIAIEDYNWQTEETGDVLISVNAYGTRSALLNIRPGRAVFKMWVKSDNSFIIHLLSDSEIICNTLETILEYMSHESEELIKMSDVISSSYGQLVQAFGRPDFKDKLTLFYKSYMPPCALPKKASITVHTSFMETFLKQVENYSPQSEFRDRVFALKVLFLNPTLYCGHSDKCDVKFKTNENNESDDVSLIKIRNVAATKIQALFKTLFILKLKQIHNDSHTSYFKVFECLKKIYVDMFSVTNRMNRCCDLIRKFLLDNIHMISVRNYYSVIKDLSYTTRLQHFTGSEQVPLNSWVAISRHVFHCIHSREISVKINLFCNIPTFMVRVFDNDSNKEITRHTNNVLVYKYSANLHGYTVLSYGWSDREDRCNWKLDFTTLKSDDCVLIIPNVNIYNYVLKYNYTPNANNYMCRCIINIDHDVSITLRLSANYEDVVFRFRCVNELGQVFGEVIGKQNVILPNVMLKYIPVIDIGNYVYNESLNVSPKSSKLKNSTILKRTSKKSLRSLDKLSKGKRSSKDINKREDSSQEIKYKETTYLVEAFVIDDSWPLTNGEWDIVQEIKSKRSIEYLYVPDSQAEGSISSKKKRSQSGSSKCSTGYSLFPISPYCTLEVISNSNDKVTAQIDNRRDEEVIEIKKKWYGDDSERYIKSKLLRNEYLESHYLPFQFEAQLWFSEESTTKTSAEIQRSSLLSDKLKSDAFSIDTSITSLIADIRTIIKPTPPDKVLPPFNLDDYKTQDQNIESRVKGSDENSYEKERRQQDIDDFQETHERFKYDLHNFICEQMGRYELLQEFYTGCTNQSKDLVDEAYSMRNTIINDIIKNDLLNQKPKGK